MSKKAKMQQQIELSMQCLRDKRAKIEERYIIDVDNALVRVKGTIGLYITRKNSCTCPGYRRHNRCKHYQESVAAYRELQVLCRQLQDLQAIAKMNGIAITI